MVLWGKSLAFNLGHRVNKSRKGLEIAHEKIPHEESPNEESHKLKNRFLSGLVSPPLA